MYLHTANQPAQGNGISHQTGHTSLMSGRVAYHRTLREFSILIRTAACILSVLIAWSAAAQADQPIAPTQGGEYASTVNELNDGGDPADPESQLTINLMCGKTVNAPPGYIGSLQWYRKAADLGSAQAQYYLAGMYENGRRVLQDYGRAVQWYRQAANQGHVKAQVTLGFLYESGRGVSQDYTQAMAWYRKAADQGFAMAQFNIGTLYEKGRGVPKDDALAEQWYRKAADQGYAQALQRLAEKDDVGHTVRIKNDGPAGESQKSPD